MKIKQFKINILPPDTKPRQCTCFLCGQKTTRAYLFTGPGKDCYRYVEGVDLVKLQRVLEGDWDPPLLYETCTDCPPTVDGFEQKLVARLIAKELEG
jgi:hypothetical protein